jgi:O-antigen/teichoic acid export membrane protein
MLKKMFESSVIMFASTGIGLVVEIIRIKIIAIALGTSGVGTLSLLNNFHSLATTVTCLGIGVGLVRYAANFRAENNEQGAREIFAHALLLNGCASVLFVVIALVFNRQFSRWIFGSPEFTMYIIVFAIATPAATYPIVSTDFLKALKWIKTVALITILRTIASLALIVPLVLIVGLKGAVISVPVVAVVHGLINAWFLNRGRCRYAVPFPVVIRWNYFGRLLRYGMASTMVSGMTYLSYLLVKRIIVQTMGIDSNGIYQCAWALTFTYLSIGLASMGTYFYPHLCSAGCDRERVEESNAMLYTSLLLLMPFFFMLMISGRWMVVLLYSNAFSGAYNLFPLQIAGCFFLAIQAQMALHPLATGRLKTVVAGNSLQIASMLVLSYIFAPRWGMRGIAGAFAISQLVNLIFFYLSAVLQIGFRLWPRNAVMVTASFTALLLVGGVQERFGEGMRMWLSIACVIAWAGVVVRVRDLMQLRSYGRDLAQRLLAYRKTDDPVLAPED